MKKPADLTTEELQPYFAEYVRRTRTGVTARPKVMKPCPFCKKKFGARDLRTHKPGCPKKPKP